MMNKIFLICAGLMISLFTQGQDKFSRGYYMTQAGDTVKGFIQHKNNYNSQFLFRPSNEGEVQKKFPEEIVAFGCLGGQTFGRLSNPLNSENETVFGEFLGRGEEINLLRYQGKLVLQKNDGTQFLLEKKGKNPTEARLNFQKNVGIFNRLFFECNSVKESAAKVSPNSISFLKLLEDYHNCKNSDFRDLMVHSRLTFKLGFFVGWSTSPTITFKNQKSGRYSYLSRTNFSNSSNITFGAIKIFYSKTSPFIVFQQEITYSRFSFGGTSYLSYSFGGYDITETSATNFDHGEIGYKFGTRISIRSNVINPYFAGGVSANLPVGFNGVTSVTKQINSSIETNDDFPKLNGLNVGLWISVGITKRMEKGQIFFDVTPDNVFLKESGNRLSLISRIGYMF